jgi:HK97 family phage major capsid protein
MAWSLVFLRLIAAAGGNTVDTLSGGKPTRAYLGYPVVIDQTWPSGAASTDYSNLAMIGFGALELSARLGDRRGFRVAVLRELFAVNDQVGVIATERVDINVHDLGDNTTPGPFVCLIGQ